MKDARGRKLDVVVVARFDRFARSISHLLREKAREMLQSMSAREVARQLGVSRGVVERSWHR